jgi:transposase-like protein
MFGTDGEKALSNALQMVFKEAKHLRCFLHFKSNLEDRLKSLNIPKFQRVEFLRDVFGKPAEFEGLVDAENEECFDAPLINLQDNREREFNDPPAFYNWFVTNCQEVVRTTMLKPVRMYAGLGNPHQPFYTNDVESHNNVIKKHITAQELPQFVEKMRSLIVNQKEIECAAVGIGEHRVSKDFAHLAVDARKYVLMSDKQKVNAIFSAPYKSKHLSDAQNKL